MGKETRRGLYILPRDRALFDYLFVHKIATANQINRDIFGISDLDTVVKRLRTLVRHHFLRRTTIDNPLPRFAYYLASGTFQKYLAERIRFQWRQLKSDTRHHDIVLVDIKKRFTGCERVLSYFTENAMESALDCPPSFPVKSFVEMHADAGIIFKVKDRTFNMAIEYEASPKSADKYIAHFTAYNIRNEIQGVIYIVKEPSLRKRLAEIEKPLSQNRRPKVFFGDLSDVLNPDKKLTFINNTQDILLIG